MDEPTNDLDIESLELLEELLMDFEGTVLIVSHDRTFMDNVITSTFAFEGDGQINDYVGGYSDAIEQIKQRAKQDGNTPENKEATEKPTPPTTTSTSSKTKKLSYKEQQELTALPDKIDQTEQKIESLSLLIADGSLFKDNPAKAVEVNEQLSVLSDQLEQYVDRWAELEH